MNAIFITRTGKRVRTIGRPFLEPGTKVTWKVPCIRTDTQGLHGNLAIKRMTPMNSIAVRMFEKYGTTRRSK